MWQREEVQEMPHGSGNQSTHFINQTTARTNNPISHMSLIAKFSCSYVEPTAGETETIHLYAVYADDGPNKKWSEATPGGSLTMTISNPSAKGQVVAGKDYKITIEEAPEGF
jgi:hypothetical protein